MVPFEFLEPGVVKLTIPDTGWELSDRKAFALAVTRSCASGPTGLILESNTRAVTEAGPNHMLDLLDQLRESITCIGAEFTCPSSRRLKATWCCERCWTTRERAARASPSRASRHPHGPEARSF